MYSWLSDALRGDAAVITANRRLARVLRRHYDEQQLGDGYTAWATPEIHAWQDWLSLLLRSASGQDDIPTQLNAHQSQLLWERCLLKDLPDAANGISRLVRLSQDAWQRLRDWRVTIREVARSAQSDDQKLFASVAGRYLAILQAEHWVDEAGLGELILELLSRQRTRPAARITFAGFDRSPPIVDAILAALSQTGISPDVAPTRRLSREAELQTFVDGDAELRAAGAWARQLLERNPRQQVAIVASGLEREAAVKSRLVREGLVPGWQYAPRSYRDAVNVSYGRSLSEYPAIAVALLALNWLVRDLSSVEVSQLMRSALLADPDTAGRSRLELGVRKLPDRRWSPAMLSSLARDVGESESLGNWFALLALLTRSRRETPSRLSPAQWAIFVDDVLKSAEWPGRVPLDSVDFQLVNRWRDLLNDLARLDLVSPSMDLKTALRRLELMAKQTVFQPESPASVVQLLGPLEASGAEFDAIWISGLSAGNWPPPGNASPLLSMRLQRQKNMPDAEPADTVDFAATTLKRLGSCAQTVVCSYAERADDAEQTASTLLDVIRPETVVPQVDPGWFAMALVTSHTAHAVDDKVPGMTPDERISGGAGTIQRQLADPISAFITGRLGVSVLQPQASGLDASLRGSILHDALYRLYATHPSRSLLAGWSDEERQQRIESAVAGAFNRHERLADDVLFQLLKLERQRMSQLLQTFIEVDTNRDEFQVFAVEKAIEFSESGIGMTLRADRIDAIGSGNVAILDYKSGARKKFLDGGGWPLEIQLVAYACAIEEPVAALALVNIDSREVVFDGAGQGYGKAEEDWEERLSAWKEQVRRGCQELSRGDVRVNANQSVSDARPLNLLSRFTELSRNAS